MSAAFHSPPRVEPAPVPPRRALIERMPGEARRRARDKLAVALCWACALVVLIPLASILVYVTVRGFAGLRPGLFTSLPKPVGEAGGGLGNAIAGTLYVIGLASTIGIPIGIGAGIYVAEVGRGRLSNAIRFVADVLSGVPSITVGVFVYALVVVAMRRFSALAGAIALAIVMIPVITRTTDELIRLVPSHLREASLALGVPAWRTSLFVVLRTALPGITTGVMLAVSRVAGETAPLLFTAFNNRFWSFWADRPIATLPVQILSYATSPYSDWQDQAWAGALVLIALVLTLNLCAQLVASRKRFGTRP